MADFIGTATVRITPDLKGFRKELTTQVDSAIKNLRTFQVSISPALSKGFTADLRKKVNTAITNSGKHYVTITPRVGSFKRQLADDLRKQNIEVPATIRGSAARTVSGAEQQIKSEAAATQSAANANKERSRTEKKLETDQESRARISKTLAESERLLAAATRSGLTDKQRDILLSQGQAKAREALIAVTNRQVENESLLKQAGLKARAERAVTKGENIAGSVSTRSNATKAISDEQKRQEATASALARENKRLAVFNEELAASEQTVANAMRSNISVAQKDEAVSAALGRAKKIEADITRRLTAAKEQENAVRVASLTAAREEAATAVSGFRQQGRIVDTLKAQEKAREGQAALTTRIASANAVEVRSLTTKAAVQQAVNAQNAISAELTRLEKSATKANEQAVLQFVRAKKAEVTTRLEALAEQRAGISASTAEAARLEKASRGAQASALSLLNIRGATLAANQSFLAGAAAITVFAKAVGSAANLQKELNVFAATANATGEQMKQVQQTAIDLGKDITLPAVSASDAAEAMTDLAKAGLGVQDAMDGARGTLQLATAAQIDNAQATELVASALNAFSLNGTEATKVADLLTGAANAAQGSIDDMGVALQQSSAVARQAGISLEDTVAFITLLAKNGIRGSDAGTSLRTALLRLVAPTDQARKILKDLNVQITDVNGNVRPEVFGDLENALSKLDSTARNQTLRKIFGQDAIRAAVIFGREGVKGLNAVRETTQREGLAAELAGARTKGFAGQVEALRNSLETLGTSLGKLTLGPLAGFVDTLNQAATSISDIVGKVQEIDTGGGGGGSGGGGFFSRLSQGIDKIGFLTGGDVIKEMRADFSLLSTDQLRFVKLTESGQQAIKRLNKELLQTLTSTDGLVRLFASVKTPDDAIAGLELMRGKIIGTSDEAKKAREQIDAIITLLVGLGRKPTVAEIRVFLGDDKVKHEFKRIKDSIEKTFIKAEIAFAEPAVQAILAKSKVTGQDAGALFLQEFGDALSPEAFAALLDKFFSGVSNVDPNIFKNLPGDNQGDSASGLGFKAIQNRIAGFDAARTRAELHKSDSELLAALNAEAEFLTKQLQSQKAKHQPAIRRLLESTLLDVNNEIASLSEKSSQAAQDRADKAKQDRDNRDQNIIKSFGVAENKINNQLIIANATEGLADDRVQNRRLLALLLQQRKQAQSLIKGLEARRDFIRETTTKIIKLRIEIRDETKKINQALRQEAADRRSRIQEGLQLDIEFANITGNKQNEIALRKKLIKALQDEIKHQKGNTNKIKELRNEIARQRQAIKELKGETQQRNNELQSLIFASLQKQTSFVGQLLGNVFSGDVSVFGQNIGGGVASPFGTGNEILPPRQVSGGFEQPRGPQAQGRAQAQANASKPGPSAAQAQTTNEILREIARLLRDIRLGNTAPEARNQRPRFNNVMEVRGD